MTENRRGWTPHALVGLAAVVVALVIAGRPGDAQQKGEWPGINGLFMATGFSGHGFQQCHAVGRHLAELILDQEPSLDLSRLGPERIIAGEPLYEHAGRII